MFHQKKPYSAVTVSIDTLTSETYDEDDLSGIPDLVEAISLQPSGPAEAARAIRKKLKYGNSHRQIRALVLLDGLLQNAGPRFQRALAADEPLLERLRVCGASELADPEVRRKCGEVFGGWARYGKHPGLERLARLHREVPKRKVMVKQETSRAVRETENPFFGDDDGEDQDRDKDKDKEDGYNENDSSSSSKKEGTRVRAGSSSLFSMTEKRKKLGIGGIGGKLKDASDKTKGKGKPFSLEAEKEQIKSVIAEGSAAATNLLNAVQTINRERERISQNKLAVERFEACKLLRRKVLRYIHHVSHEQWLGPLLHANDELVHALMTFEQLDQSLDADSDSDDELAEQAHLYRMAAEKGKKELEEASPSPDLSGLSIGSGSGATSPRSPAPGQRKPPPRPSKASIDVSSPPPKPPRPVADTNDHDHNNDDDDDDDDPFADCNTVE